MLEIKLLRVYAEELELAQAITRENVVMLRYVVFTQFTQQVYPLVRNSITSRDV